MSGLVVVGTSVACQVAAAARAIALIGVTGRRAGWLLLAAGFFGMSVRRVLAFAATAQSPDARATLHDVVGLAVSLLVLGGTTQIRSVFVSARNADEAVTERKRHEATFKLCESGEPTGFVNTTRNVAERRRTDDVLGILHETGRRILAREPLDATLAFVCDELARKLDAPLVWVGVKHPDGTVEPRASGGRGRGLLDALSLRWDADLELAPIPCRALAKGEICLALDVNRIPEAYRSASEAAGVGAVAAYPLARNDGAFGVLAVHAGRPDAIDDENLTLLERLADQVTLAFVEAEWRDAVEVRTAALESAVDAILILDEDGRVQFVNCAYEALTGWSRREVVGGRVEELEGDLHPPAFWEQMWVTLRSKSVWRGEMFGRRKDGSVFLEQQSITPVCRDNGSIRCFVAVRQDVTSEKRTKDRLLHLTHYDSLTDLPNRQQIETRLERAVSRSRRGVSSALLLIDVDNFKIVNDAGGHLAGDRILVAIAQLLLPEMPLGSELGRIGGDEFAVLLEGVDANGVRAIAERLRRRVEDHRFDANGRTFEITLSVGAVLVDGSLTAAEVLALADAAVHASKERGRNRVVLGEHALLHDSPLVRAGIWVSRIKNALRNDRLCLSLQPIVHLESGVPTHFEALLRMREGDGELILPGEFLPAAERFGLMPQIDRWVLSRTLELLEEHEGLGIFMNLSGCSLGDEDLLDEMAGMVRAGRLGAGRLSFEITETAAVADVASAREWLQRFRKLGCRFALDDFGTGFSSFSYLQALPVDYVKIDGSFVRSLEKNRTNREIVTALVAVSHSLGKETIAEAVESVAALDILRRIGVEYGQGWALGRPVDAREWTSGPARRGALPLREDVEDLEASGA